MEVNSMDWSLLKQEMLDWRKAFTLRGCLVPFFLGFVPSFWDVYTDYEYADEWSGNLTKGHCLVSLTIRSGQTRTGYPYLFICLPALTLIFVALSRQAQGFVDRTCCKCYKGCFCSLIKEVLKCSTALALFLGVFLAATECSGDLKYLSYPCAASLLGLKLMTVFVQGPTMKKIGLMATSHEATYEAGLQMFFVLAETFFQDHTPDMTTTTHSLLSSLLTITKAAVEAQLTFAINDKMTEQPFVTKIIQIVRLGPVFAFTTFHRITGLAVLFYCLSTYVVPTYVQCSFICSHVVLFGVLLLLPLIVLVLCKICYLKDILLSELVMGVFGEMFTITIWGKRGREKSRALQLIFFFSYFTLYTFLFLYVLIDDPVLETTTYFRGLYIAGLTSGLLSLPLFVVQVYNMQC